MQKVNRYLIDFYNREINAKASPESYKVLKIEFDLADIVLLIHIAHFTYNCSL